MTRGSSSPLREIAGFPALAWALAALALGIFAYYRVRFFGGCDPPGYLLEALRMRGIDAHLALDPSVPVGEPLAPLCFVAREGRAVSFFPPGYPALLALVGPFGLELHLNGVLAAATGLAIFSIARRLTSVPLALLAMVAWLASPLVFFGATQIMSDLPATAFVVFGLAALPAAGASATGPDERRAHDRRALVAGLLWGVAVGIRPTHALLAPAALALRPGRRALAAFGLGLGLALAGWALLLWLSTGSPVPAYGANAAELGGLAYGHQLVFFARELLLQELPFALLALAALALRPRESAPFAALVAIDVLFHALWNPPLELWWEARFAMPAVASIAVLGALGADAIVTRTSARTVHVGGAVVTSAFVLWSALWSPAIELHRTDFDADYEEVAHVVRRLVPDHALVGAIEASAPLRAYAGVQSFNWCHPRAPELVRWGLGAGRPIYAVLERDLAHLRCIGLADPRMPRVRYERVADVPTWRTLYRISLVPTLARIDVGAPEARTYLGAGWGDDEGQGEASFAWIVGERAEVVVPPEARGGAVLARVALDTFEPARPVALSVAVGDHVVGTFELREHSQTIEVTLPPGTERFELRTGRGVSPAELGWSDDPRPLAASVGWIELTSAEP